VKSNLGKLESIKPWLLFLTIVTIILGLASSTLQSFDKSWIKRTTIIIGGIIAAVGALKSTIYRIDYSTCDSMIVQVQSLITLQEKAIAVYESPDSVVDQKAQAFKRILHNEESLEQIAALLREAGQPILPAFLTVVHAQNFPAQNQRAIYGKAPASGGAAATTKDAAYKYAKYQALKQLADQVKPALKDSEINSAIEYLNRIADPESSSCRENKPGYYCSVQYSVPLAALRRDVMKQLGVGAEAAQPDAQLRGTKAFRWPFTGTLTVAVTGISKGETGRFEFTFAPNPKANTLTLVQIKCFDDGGMDRWVFHAAAGGATILLPVASYDDAGHPTAYSPGKYEVPLAPGAKDGQLTVTGYRFQAPQGK
jgi:hypothetical protein